MVVTIKIDIIKVVTKYQNIIKVVRLINLRVFFIFRKILFTIYGSHEKSFNNRCPILLCIVDTLDGLQVFTTPPPPIFFIRLTAVYCIIFFYRQSIDRDSYTLHSLPCFSIECVRG